ncbi:hypothetical protein ATANTOWER_023999 [Ataeniobius toweri]|uniref:Uncharacterized protein n=1 Tax=Ataeniobius toweri TaxID=208326 RepID=A0ABU7AUS4_9TELE|nr:hypothetical protein [Ataeniobius toweri]
MHPPPLPLPPFPAFSLASPYPAEPRGRANWQSSVFDVFCFLAFAFFKFYSEYWSFRKGLRNHSVQMQRKKDTLGGVPSLLGLYMLSYQLVMTTSLLNIHCPGILTKVAPVAAAAQKVPLRREQKSLHCIFLLLFLSTNSSSQIQFSMIVSPHRNPLEHPGESPFIRRLSTSEPYLTLTLIVTDTYSSKHVLPPLTLSSSLLLLSLKGMLLATL